LQIGLPAVLCSNWIALRLAMALMGCLALGQLPALAQGLPSPLPASNPAPIVYCPPERLSAGSPSPYHVLNVFLPRGPVPAGGWPVVVATGYGGGASVPAVSSLSLTAPSAPLWNLVAAGIAVVHYGTPGLGNNRGLWYPPGHPSGRYESYRPQDDNPEKSAEWALQWTKVQTLYPFDVTRVGLRGSSGGAVLAIRTAMGPDRARATGSAQVRASTRVAAILAIQPPTSAWALEQGPELLIPFPKHLEQAARPGVASTQLSQADPELQKDYSLMRVAFASAEARANNVQQPLCLVFGDPVLRIGGAVAPFDLDAGGFPILTDRIKQPLQHDSWFGYVFWKRLIELSPASAAFHAANSVFAMRDVNALAPPLAYHTRTYSGTVLGAQAARLGHDWLVARLLGPQPFVARSVPPPPAALTRPALSSDCASARAGSLFVLEGEPRPGARLVLGLRGPQGAVALLALARSPLSACGTRRPAGELRIDPQALLRPLRLVRLTCGGGPTPVTLEIPFRNELLGLEVYAQALVLEPDARWLTDALALPVWR
jgi:hypothetical protein